MAKAWLRLSFSFQSLSILSASFITVRLSSSLLSLLLLLPPPKEVMFLVWAFCLFVCLSDCPSDNWKSCQRILTKFLEGIGYGPGTNEFNFGDDLDHRPDPGVRSPKSAFTWLSKKLSTDFDEILWRAGVWPRDQLITFWWRSASLSGSGSPFWITIRIREELPQFYYAGVRRRSVLSEYF